MQGTQPKSVHHRHRRTLSVISADGSAAKIALAIRRMSLDAEPHAAAGAFTLTGCARDALGAALHGRWATASPSDSVEDEWNTPGDNYDEAEAKDDFLPALSYTVGGSPPASPTTSFASIPSFSRTASPFSDFDSEPHTSPVPIRRVKGRGKERERERARTNLVKSHGRDTTMNEKLYLLERSSRMGTGRVVCSACKKEGINFPRCARCANMWCSRECRVGSTHQCRK
ncbi:hypothetical protein C8J57DRAFT_1127341 [Mycena rebaudengoi]|nr:hypothetical protein C8J57DRAFT_1127341 [Mycena rebaudengoi]